MTADPTEPGPTETRLTETARRRLRDDPIAWVCTLRPDGTPHLTPTWFFYDAEVWWICVTEASAKARHLAGDQRVAIHLESGDTPVVAEGIARIHRQHDFAAPIRRAFFDKYDGWDIDTLEQDRWCRILLEVPVDRWLLSGVPQ